MKNSLVVFVFFCMANIFAQNYYMATPQGFGANATGGGNATPVTVTNFTQLKAALPSTSTNKVILISGTIDCSYWSVLMTNVSIIGLPGARLRNLQITVGNSTASAAASGMLYIKPGSNNVIIRNIIFEGPGAYDVDGRDNLTNEGTNVWVDHCEFQDGIDGNFDNKGMCDNTTISWCKFTYLKPAIPGGSGGSNDHRFSNLVGSSATDFPADGHYSLTFQNCYWASGCKERMPRARNAELHLLNCYYYANVTSSKSIGLGGGSNNTTCYVEKCNFANISTVYGSYISTDGGTVAINFSNCLNGVANIGTVNPPIYSTTPMPVTDVANYITDSTCGAGATLQVSASGVIAPNDCAFLGINTNPKSTISVFASVKKDYLYIDFSNIQTSTIDVDIFSINGQKVSTYLNKNTNSSNLLELSLEELSSGIYLGIVKYNDQISNFKFIKN